MRVDDARLMRCSAAMLLAYAALLAACAWWGLWFVTAAGPQDTDFLGLWTAGRMALEGRAADAYDWAIHRRMEIDVVGHAMAGYYGWHYPPTFLLVLAPLSLLTYVPAWLLWSALTAAFLVRVLWLVVPRPAVVMALMAAPATLWCVVAGQTGFLTAALMGGALGLAERWPVLAGLFLGLLTYKPHFGLLFPIALIAGHRWRMIASAAATTMAVALVAALAFGQDSWTAFFHSVTATVDDVLRVGRPGWSKLQSFYALLHGWGVGEATAMAVQGTLILGLAGGVAWAFARPLRFPVQAALLAAASLLATPYGYVYDLPVLAVAAAFLVRDGCRPGDGWILAVALAMPFAFMLLGSATTPAAAALVIGVALRRCRGGPAQG